MIEVLAFYLLWIISIIGTGYFISGIFEKCLGKFELDSEILILYYGTVGLAIISVVGTILNFFIPLTFFVSILMLLFGIGVFLIRIKQITTNIKISNYIIIFIVFIYCGFFPLMRLMNYDIGLYYLSAMKWITNAPLPFGLANLYDRLGFNCSWFINASIIQLPRDIIGNYFFIVNAIISFLYGSFIFLNLHKIIEKKQLRISSIFALFTFIPWFFCLANLISSPSADVPVMLLTFFTTYMIIRSLELKDNNYLIGALILSLYVVTIKLSATPYFIGLLALTGGKFIIQKKKRSIFIDNFSKYFYASTAIVLIGVPYAARGIVSSGFVAFPSAFFNMHLKWSTPINYMSNTAMYIKCWPMSYNENCYSQLNNWDWFHPWFEQKIASEGMIILFFIIGIMLIVTNIFTKKCKEKMLFVVVFSLSLFGCIFWFLLGPDPRFGYGYLYSLVGIMVSWGIYNQLRERKFPGVFFRILFVLSIVLLFFQKSIKIDDIHYIKRIPKIEYQMVYTSSKDVLFIPKEGHRCFDGPLLCIPYLNSSIKVYYNGSTPNMFTRED